MATNETIQIQPNTWNLIKINPNNEDFTILEIYSNNNNLRYSFDATATNGIPAENKIVCDRDIYVRVITTDTKDIDLIIERR